MRTPVLALCLLLPTASALAQTRSTDDAAIRKSVAAFESAINHRDARAMAGLFSRNGDFIFFDSPRMVGRDSITKATDDAISKWPSTRRFSLEVTAIRFLGSDLALVETLARFSEGEMTSNRGTALMARREGKWVWEALRVYPAQRG